MVSAFMRKFSRLVTFLRQRVFSPECKVCGGTTEHKTAYNRNFYRCRECTFVFALDFSPEPAKRGMGMEGSWTGPGGGGFREYYLAKMLSKELGKEKILLFGTGNTQTFEKLRNERMQVVGCDVSQDVVNYKQEKFGKETFFTPDNLPDDIHFDVIIAVEVFEHLSNPKETFTMLLAKLESNGIICGTTDFYQGGQIEDGNTPGYMSLGGHIAYWSTQSLGYICTAFDRSLTTFEMVRPGSVLPDEKYGQLYPNKRVFFIYTAKDHHEYFSLLQKCSPILPIDKA